MSANWAVNPPAFSTASVNRPSDGLWAAVAWQSASVGDWTAYAADVACRITSTEH
jgi:hypothetical protein